MTRQTAHFVIERICPRLAKRFHVLSRLKDPIPVEIYTQAVPGPSCGADYWYEITPECLESFAAKRDVHPPPRFICSHMGRVVQ